MTWFLQETNSAAAPAYCFKQAPDPPDNEFEENMKLEAPDPRCVTSTCIATVIGVAGTRIRLRLDGSDTQNDFWRLVDSTDIHEIGHCERLGGMLQPPLSYTKSVNGWQTFLVKQLKNAVLAPASAFKPEPITPSRNMFKVGQKLEAVDTKHQYLICCATVNAVVDDRIHVVFDGWKTSSGYWTRFDSRDIFPVKWCERSGHILQPPGKQYDSNANRRKSDKSCASNYLGSDEVLSTATPKTVHFRTKCRGGDFINSTRLPSKVTSPTHKSLAKLCLQEILAASSNALQLSALLSSVHGEKSAVTVSNKTYTVSKLFFVGQFIDPSTNRNAFQVKIPYSNSMNESELAQYFQSICSACKACPNMVTLEAGPEQCDKCITLEQKEEHEQEHSRKGETNREHQHVDDKRQQQLNELGEDLAQLHDEKKRAIKRTGSTLDFDTESSSSLSSTSSKISMKSISEDLIAKVPKIDTSMRGNVQANTPSFAPF